MRKLLAAVLATGLMGGVALAQNPQRDTPATQPGAAGQKQGSQSGVTGGVQTTQGQTGQGQTRQGQAGQVQPAQPGRPAQPGQPSQPGQQAQPGQQGQASADQQVAACIYGECHNEIEIAKFAESKAQNDDVREFAQRMVRDHSASCEEMKKAAGHLADSSHDRGHETAGRSAPRGAGGALDWISIKKEIGQKCLESVKKELSSKQGADFDECFMGQQVGAHMKMVDELQVLRNHVSSELQQKIDKDLQVAQQHLQLAKQVAQKAKDRSSERVSRRPESK
jgi:putative membrane protein